MAIASPGLRSAAEIGAIAQRDAARRREQAVAVGVDQRSRRAWSPERRVGRRTPADAQARLPPAAAQQRLAAGRACHPSTSRRPATTDSRTSRRAVQTLVAASEREQAGARRTRLWAGSVRQRQVGVARGQTLGRPARGPEARGRARPPPPAARPRARRRTAAAAAHGRRRPPLAASRRRRDARAAVSASALRQRVQADERDRDRDDPQQLARTSRKAAVVAGRAADGARPGAERDQLPAHPIAGRRPASSRSASGPSQRRPAAEPLGRTYATRPSSCSARTTPTTRNRSSRARLRLDRERRPDPQPDGVGKADADLGLAIGTQPSSGVQRRGLEAGVVAGVGDQRSGEPSAVALTASARSAVRPRPRPGSPRPLRRGRPVGGR